MMECDSCPVVFKFDIILLCSTLLFHPIVLNMGVTSAYAGEFEEQPFFVERGLKFITRGCCCDACS